MIWGLLYLVLLGTLFVRVQATPTAAPVPQFPLPGEPLSLVMLHHRIFYLLLLAVPVEALLLGGRPGGRLAGAALFALGVALYRIGGGQLGESRSPFVLPKAGAPLVTAGLYRWIRHPMYLGHALIALGAPLTLGVRWTAWLAVPALAVLLYRVGQEDAALRERYPDYAAYAASTKRLVPFIY